jgi:glycosyltransferase involved in cell wall biosynthesis
MALHKSRSPVEYILATLGGKGAWSEWMEGLNQRPEVLSILGGGSFIPIVKILRAIRKIRTIAPNIIYVVGIRAAVLIRILKPFLGPVKIVHGIRTTFRPGTSLTRKFLFAERLLRSFTDAYVANSIAGASSVISLFGVSPKKVHVIPNGVEVPEEVVQFSGTRSKVVVIVANLHPLKGHREFIDVVGLVHAKQPDTKFRFVGRDDMNGEVERDAMARGLRAVIEFSGFQENIWPFLTSAQVFALPSRETEGAPTSILEAFGAGLPVVAFAIGGVPNLIHNGIDGRIVEQFDSSAMARAIVELLNDVTLATKMGKSGQRKVLSTYSIDATATRHADLWQELTDKT